MPASDYDAALLTEVQFTCLRGRWRVHLRYDAHLYDLGTFLHYADAHRACSASALEKALGSPEKRAKREVAEGGFSAQPQSAGISSLLGTGARTSPNH